MLLMGLLLVGCAGVNPKSLIHNLPSVPSKVILTNVPFYAQKKYQCGPAALAMTLSWAGVKIRPDQLASMVYTPGRKGSLQSGLVTAARRHGRLAYPLKGLSCLIREVAAGRPIIVLQNLGLGWLPRWHYAVVIGYDVVQRQMILHTGESAFRRIGLKTFTSTWKRSDDWGLGVLPVDQMPECAEEIFFLNAAHGLQKADHLNAATTAFRNAVSRWPESVEANMALGNAHYRQGAIQEAIHAYTQAIQLEPQNGDALNNLAHLLSESGEIEAAEQMADRAVAVGGPQIGVYRQTLNEIRQKRR